MDREKVVSAGERETLLNKNHTSETSTKSFSTRSREIHSDDDGSNNPPPPSATGCIDKCILIPLLLSVFTDWPLKISKYILGYTGESSDQSFSCTRYMQWVYVFIRLLMAIVGLVVQGLTCLRRDRLDKMSVKNVSNHKLIECDEPLQLFSAIFIPDVIVFGLLMYVSWRRLFCISKALPNEHPLEDIPSMANDKYKMTSSENLCKLVDSIINSKKPDKFMRIVFPLIPILYVICSQLVSLLNLYVFGLMNDTIVIHWPLLKWNIHGSWKISLIIMLFLGFIAFDLLYTQIVMRYVFQCQMNSYFLQIILDNVQSRKKYEKYDDAMKDVVKAHDFLKCLNEISLPVGLVILIASFQATKSIVGLSNPENNVGQILALLLRLICWTFLALFPVHLASRTNHASIKIHGTGLIMRRKPIQFKRDDSNSKWQYKHAVRITLKTKLFGISISPWFPYVIIVLILFTLMAGSGLKWYERLKVV